MYWISMGANPAASIERTPRLFYGESVTMGVQCTVLGYTRTRSSGLVL